MNVARHERVAPRIPDHLRVYAVGDIHGRNDLLRVLLGMIQEDSARAPASPQRHLVYLGDYVDRGPDSKSVIDTLLANPLPGFSVRHLCGNHEDMLNAFLEDPAHGRHWLFNGGKETLRSYGVDPNGEIDDVRDRLHAALPPAHRDFLRRLSMREEIGDYAFVHAGVRPGVPIAEQDHEDLLWIRDEFLTSDADFGKVVVHGHTPGRQVVLAENRIGLDTGAFASGRLSAVVLSGDKRRIIQT
jgi:serine/threonine protein phosphatase 1